MSLRADPSEVLRRCLRWDAGSFVIESLSGGLTNRSFAVSRGDERFVLRLDGIGSSGPGLDRHRELRILREAHTAGLAPEVCFADPQAGFLLTRFVAGRRWSREDLTVASNIDAVCDLLRRVNALPGTDSRFDPVSAARAYFTRLRDSDWREFGERCVAVATRAADDARDIERRCCHNDVIAENLIGITSPILLDWEFACDNEPLFDVASVLSYHELDARAADRWLFAFAGDASPQWRQRLVHQRRLYDALYGLWLAARECERPTGSQRDRLHRIRAGLDGL